MHQENEFVSEPITPARGTADGAAMSRGEPGLPSAFTWRGKSYGVIEILSKWKTSTSDRGELYLRRHWFEIRSAEGARLTVYCDRQVKNRRKPSQRWWLYSISRAASQSAPPDRLKLQ
jgi:hypothetical protein